MIGRVVAIALGLAAAIGGLFLILVVVLLMVRGALVLTGAIQ